MQSGLLNWIELGIFERLGEVVQYSNAGTALTRLDRLGWYFKPDHFGRICPVSLFISMSLASKCSRISYLSRVGTIFILPSTESSPFVESLTQ